MSGRDYLQVAVTSLLFRVGTVYLNKDGTPVKQLHYTHL